MLNVHSHTVIHPMLFKSLAIVGNFQLNLIRVYIITIKMNINYIA